METEELVVGEYVIRGCQNAETKQTTAKKHNVNIIGILAATVLTVAGIVMAVIPKEKAAAQNAVNNECAQSTANGNISEEITKGALESACDTKTIVPDHMVSDLYMQITPGQFERLAGKVLAKLEAEKAKETVNDTFDSDEEIIGLFGGASDFYALFHANDPKMPDYLSCSINKNFRLNLSQNELYEFMKLVEAEAPKEDIYGKILVANVVLNRVLANFGATVHDVIFDENQFTPTLCAEYWETVTVTDSAREAVTRALAGEDYSQGAVFFYAWEKHPDFLNGNDWRSNCKFLFIHGGHAFLK